MTDADFIKLKAAIDAKLPNVSAKLIYVSHLVFDEFKIRNWIVVKTIYAQDTTIPFDVHTYQDNYIEPHKALTDANYAIC